MNAVAEKVVEDADALLEASRNGDVAAFSSLYAHYRLPLLRMCLRRVKDPALAEDVVQDAFVRAFVKLPTLDLSRPFWPWLITVAEGRCIDLYRMSKGITLLDGTEPDDGDGLRVSGCPTDEDSTFDAVYSADERRRLALALSQLPHRQRRALLLFAIRGWQYAEIATAEGISILATKSLIFRARERLRELCQVGVPGLIWWRRGVSSRRTRQKKGSLYRLAGRTSERFAGFIAPLGHSLLPLVVSLATIGAPVAQASSLHDGGVAAQVSVRTYAGPGSGEALRQPHGSTDNAPTVGDLIGNIAKPDDAVNDPEDTRVTSITMSPAFGTDRTIYAVGAPPCLASCSPALFKSTDAGASWSRLAAAGFDGRTVLLPPGGRDRRIFAMGTSGLQVSGDGGASFDLAVPTGALLLGSAAISPAFEQGDPRILIGAQALMQYDDRVRVYAPSPYSSLPGPLEPAFSPGFADDGVLVVGGVTYDPTRGKSAVIYRCTSAVCDAIALRGTRPRIKLASDFGRGGAAFAFDDGHLFVSDDGARSFREVAIPAPVLTDVAPMGGRALIASGLGADGAGGVFLSSDLGSSWTRADDPLFAGGARAVVVTGDRVLAATGNGLACSTDRGRTWQRRCAS